MPIGPEVRRRSCSDPDLPLKLIPIKLEATVAVTQGHVRGEAPLQLISAPSFCSLFALGEDDAEGDTCTSFPVVGPIIPEEAPAALSLPSSLILL